MHPGDELGHEQPSVVEAAGLQALFDALHSRGFTVMGPAARDGAIVVTELASAADLPYGWGVETEAGRYRLRARRDTAAFGHSAGPQSWKSVLHPARARMWSADRATGDVTGEPAPSERYALLGVRPCDLAAIGILDRASPVGNTPTRSTPAAATATSSSPWSAPSRAPPASAPRWVPARTPSPGLTWP